MHNSYWNKNHSLLFDCYHFFTATYCLKGTHGGKPRHTAETDGDIRVKGQHEGSESGRAGQEKNNDDDHFLGAEFSG